MLDHVIAPSSRPESTDTVEPGDDPASGPHPIDPELGSVQFGSAAATDALGAPAAPGVSRETLLRVERAAGGMATRSVARMDEELPWFRTLPPEQRSWVNLVAQAGIAGYVTWANGSGSDLRLTDKVFGTAPRDLIRAVSLRRTVELVRVAITVAEQHLPSLASNDAEHLALRESLLRYSREIAFAAAAVYAAAAETRGAWDARVESAVVDGIVRGEDAASLTSRAAALAWDTAGETLVVVGAAPAGTPDESVATVAEWAHRRRRSSLAGVHGTTLIVVLSGERAPGEDVAELFGEGPVVRGPVGSGLAGAVESGRHALSGLAVASAWPAAPRPVDAGALLVERVLAGDQIAADRLRGTVFRPISNAGAPLLVTIEAYAAHGGSLEPAARSLFIHANTMRYRLRRIAELTGLDPWSPRDLATLRIAVILGRLENPAI